MSPIARSTKIPGPTPEDEVFESARVLVAVTPHFAEDLLGAVEQVVIRLSVECSDKELRESELRLSGFSVSSAWPAGSEGVLKEVQAIEILCLHIVRQLDLKKNDSQGFSELDSSDWIGLGGQLQLRGSNLVENLRVAQSFLDPRNVTQRQDSPVRPGATVPLTAKQNVLLSYLQRLPRDAAGSPGAQKGPAICDALAKSGHPWGEDEFRRVAKGLKDQQLIASQRGRGYWALDLPEEPT